MNGPWLTILKSFAAMLVQTEKLGTSLAQSLRIFSDSLRTIRRQRAEEAAAKTAIKLVFPLVFFIFPAILVVILGPAYDQDIKVLYRDVNNFERGCLNRWISIPYYLCLSSQ